jgi:hypothetical protein
LKNKHEDDYRRYMLLDKKENFEFDAGIANRLLSRYVAASTISFNQATSPELSKFLSYLNPVYKLPSRGTLTSMIQDEAELAKNLIRSLLNDAPMVSFFKEYISIVLDPHFY